MNAKYIIETAGEQLIFEGTALSLKKSLQIKRLGEANKTWKGYSLIKMRISQHGLDELHIKHV